MKARTRSGFTIIEMLVAMLISVTLGAGLYTLVRSSYDSQWELMNQNNANLGARQSIDFFADHLRGAAAVTAASATDVTFTDNSGNSIRYWLNTSDSTLRSTTNASPTGGNIVVQDVTALKLTYWSWNSSTSSWTSSTAPSDVTVVGAVDIAATVNMSGYSRQVFSSVEIRQKRLSYQ